jgi:hypothetical protein
MFIDIDEYLLSITNQWCKQTLQELGYPNLSREATLPDGNRLHAQAYIQLRSAIHEHIRLGQEPLLCETQKPIGAWTWRNQEMQGVAEEIDDNMENIEEVDIFNESVDLEY